jgi:hypothetical protein
MMLNENMIVLPKTQAVIDSLKTQPTEEERILALENAVSDLALILIGVSSNE